MDLAPKIEKRRIEEAQATLRSLLEKLLGPDLPGVSGFGARLDRATRMMALDVMVEDRGAADRAAASLPSAIDGLPVKIHRRGPAFFE
jgi:hypothetical protein